MGQIDSMMCHNRILLTGHTCYEPITIKSIKLTQKPIYLTFFYKDRVQHVFRLQHKEPPNICLGYNYNELPEQKLNLFQYH